MAGGKHTPTLDEVREYWDRYTNDVEIVDQPIGSDAFFDDLERYRYEKIDYLRSYVDFPRYRGKKVLEIGCGPGVDSLQFARAGVQLTAVDLSPNAVEMAKMNLAREGHTADIRVGNAEQLEFADGTFDVVYSVGVLHHTVDTQRSIDEVYRVLKPGGEAVLLLYNRRSWMVLLSKLTGTPIEHAEQEAPIVRSYTTRECRRMLSRFRELDVQVDRFPKRTVKFKGIKALLFNYGIVPLFAVLPRSMVGPLGFHILLRATK
jgi:ubiquinone/menaquinone biosynthesis C-methylase UbiE